MKSETNEVMEKLKTNQEVKKIFLHSRTSSEFFQRVNFWLAETSDPYFYFKKKKLNRKIFEQEIDLLWDELNIPKTKVSKKISEEDKEKSFINNLSYSIMKDSKIISEFVYFEEWMKAFFIIGEFLSKYSKFNIYISYVDSLIPAMFSIFGYVHSKYKSYISTDFIYLFDKFEIGKELCFKTSENEDTWELRTFRGIDKQENSVLLENKNQLLINYVTEQNIPFRVRVKGNVKMAAGRGAGLKMNDHLSPKMSYLYGTKVLNEIKVMNEHYVNICGRAIFDEIEEIMSYLVFQLPNQKKFYLSDILCFQNSDTNFWNIENIMSNREKKENGRLNVFIGENNAINFGDLMGEKNIVFADRKNIDKPSHEVFFDQIRRSTTEEASLILDLKTHFAKSGIEFPRGVEIIAW